METINLYEEDLAWCKRRLPAAVYRLLKEPHSPYLVGGGFVRGCVANEKLSDVDVFAPTAQAAKDGAEQLAEKIKGSLVKTDNAYTVYTPLRLGLPVQFIHRWTYETPAQLLESFDFTIARAVIWHVNNPDTPHTRMWRGIADSRFYTDLVAKRLRYCSPVRNEDAGGSLLRVLKFYERGYRIPLDSYGAVVARVVAAVEPDKLPRGDENGPIPLEAAWAKVITGLLREVDPSIDPDHDWMIEHQKQQETNEATQS